MVSFEAHKNGATIHGHYYPQPLMSSFGITQKTSSEFIREHSSSSKQWAALVTKFLNPSVF